MIDESSTYDIRQYLLSGGLYQIRVRRTDWVSGISITGKIVKGIVRRVIVWRSPCYHLEDTDHEDAYRSEAEAHVEMLTSPMRDLVLMVKGACHE